MLFDPFDPIDFFIFDEVTKTKKGESFFDDDDDFEDEDEDW